MGDVDVTSRMHVKRGARPGPAMENWFHPKRLDAMRHLGPTNDGSPLASSFSPGWRVYHVGRVLARSRPLPGPM